MSERHEIMNSQLNSAIEALNLQNTSTVRVTVPLIYHLDSGLVNVDNVWNLLLLQFVTTCSDMYKDSVLLNRSEVLSISPIVYAGRPVLDAVAHLVVNKLKHSGK